MKKILLYAWQLPQNLLGLAVIYFSKAKKSDKGNGLYSTKYMFGVSLGNYIILNQKATWIDLYHEEGHQKQSLFLGWLYLIVIGLPSACGNLVDRVAHKNHRKDCWYYKQPWEAWADKLGGVKR